MLVNILEKLMLYLNTTLPPIAQKHDILLPAGIGFIALALICGLFLAIDWCIRK